jgi:2-methylisocitrate lyase-like PEP mutase family enzyme
VSELAALGVHRISFGSALSHAALSAFNPLQLARLMKKEPSFAAETFSLCEISDFVTGNA